MDNWNIDMFTYSLIGQVAYDIIGQLLQLDVKVVHNLLKGSYTPQKTGLNKKPQKDVHKEQKLVWKGECIFDL